MSYRTKLLLAFGGLALFACGLVSLFIGKAAVLSIFEQTRATVLAAAVATAERIDGDAHQRIVSAESAELLVLEKELHEARDGFREAGIETEFVYTFKPVGSEPSDWIYVADGETDGDRKSTYGDPFVFEAVNEADLKLMLDRKARADLDYTSDKYGTYLSADAPILDSRGVVVARLGVDLRADYALSVKQDLVMKSLMGLGAAMLVSVSIAVLLSQWVNRPLEEVSMALDKLGNGDVESRIKVTRTDEFGKLQLAVNTLADSLLQRNALRGSLSRYVSRDVADDVGHLDREVEVIEGGVRKRITVVFCDFDDFEKMAEGQKHEEVFNCGGTLDRFFGAGLMATFGATSREQDHERAALESAKLMQEAMAEVDQQLRVGICTGYASVSDGEDNPFMAVKAVGDAVNMAARVLAKAKEVNAGILVCKTTMHPLESSGDFHFEQVGTLKGDDGAGEEVYRLL
jgi:class 3 adenylate cyclase